MEHERPNAKVELAVNVPRYVWWALTAALVGIAWAGFAGGDYLLVMGGH